MDTILHPIMWLVAWVMYGIHQGLTAIGMDAGAGPAWVLSIIGLTIVVRLIVLPLYNRQIRASRQTQILQPEIQKIQKKYKGKKDRLSQQRQQEEMQALYRKHGTSPFASCLPMLVQMPILFSLYRVLYAFPSIASGNRGALGPIDTNIAAEFENSTVFGAPLSASFSQPGADPSLSLRVRIIAALFVLLLSLTMFFTQKQLTMKNMPESSMDRSNPAYQMQKYMLYGMPAIYLVTGVAFQIGVLVYWVAGNFWNMGQQAWFIRNNPTPGSKAYKERQERLRQRRIAKGLPPEEDSEAASEVRSVGQRQQPVGKSRAKKAAAKATPKEQVDRTASAQAAMAGDVDANEATASNEGEHEVRGKDGLTDAERARKRYERRQAERQRSRAKQQQRKKKQQQNQKKRNF
ncbi:MULTISPECIES: membrane protein insertase YidC [unclassified Actinobaculum]|uniref:membrane protein insertase YidC n=1 Tax=unclassified Actinobaculum TaxID=2609299 RepID=UPI000D52594B|nr:MULTISPECIES: membrane protein insertase YidC [unclassified Actinobaculum]AWE43334.1 membrane protein insertase YidC [Actinobaculum sp. 313]RTE49768.1 membrane protein insertase YidC [Actinobaculum sp. 352]